MTFPSNSAKSFTWSADENHSIMFWFWHENEIKQDNSMYITNLHYFSTEINVCGISLKSIYYNQLDNASITLWVTLASIICYKSTIIIWK